MKRVVIFAFVVFAWAASAQELIITIENRDFKAGDTVRAEYAVQGFNNIVAFQYGMMFDTAALRIAGISDEQPINIGFGLFSMGYLVEPGEIRCVFTDPYGVTLDDGELLYSVVFVAKKDGDLSQFFAMYPQGLTAHAWQFLLTEIPFSVIFTDVSEGLSTNEQSGQAGISVSPNPTPDLIRVWVDMQEPGKVLLNVVDSAGYTVFGRRFDHAGKGQQQFVAEAPNSGIYFVVVNAGKVVKTEKVFKK